MKIIKIYKTNDDNIFYFDVEGLPALYTFNKYIVDHRYHQMEKAMQDYLESGGSIYSAESDLEEPVALFDGKDHDRLKARYEEELNNMISRINSKLGEIGIKFTAKDEASYRKAKRLLNLYKVKQEMKDLDNLI